MYRDADSELGVEFWHGGFYFGTDVFYFGTEVFYFSMKGSDGSVAKLEPKPVEQNLLC